MTTPTKLRCSVSPLSPFPGLVNTLAPIQSDDTPFFSALSTTGAHVFPISQLSSSSLLSSQSNVFIDAATAHAAISPNIMVYATDDRVCLRTVDAPEALFQMQPIQSRVQTLALAYRCLDAKGAPREGRPTHLFVVTGSCEGVHVALVPLTTSSIDFATTVPALTSLGGPHVQSAVVVRASTTALAAATMDGRVAIWYNPDGEPDVVISQPEASTVGDRITDLAFVGKAVAVAWWSGAVYMYGDVTEQREVWRVDGDKGPGENGFSTRGGTFIAVKKDMSAIAAVRGDGIVMIMSVRDGARVQRTLTDKQNEQVHVKGLFQGNGSIWLWVDGARRFVEVAWASATELDDARLTGQRVAEKKKQGRDRCRRRMDVLMAG